MNFVFGRLLVSISLSTYELPFIAVGMSVGGVDPQPHGLWELALITADKLSGPGLIPWIWSNSSRPFCQPSLPFRCFICGAHWLVLWCGVKPATGSVGSGASWGGLQYRPKAAATFVWLEGSWERLCCKLMPAATCTMLWSLWWALMWAEAVPERDQAHSGSALGRLVSVWVLDSVQGRLDNTSPGDFENMLIKAEDGETKWLRIEEATRECLGGALLWPSRNVKGKKWVMLGCMNSLRSESHSDRSEPKQGCCQLTEKSEKADFWDRFRELAWDKLPCPLLPWLHVSWGPLRV